MASTDKPQKGLVFCGGVHGVGKTSFCRALADQMRAVHVSAGSLLRHAGFARPGQYTVLQMRKNQEYIQATLREYRRRKCAAQIVLDGHFCLLTPSRRIRVLPLALFGSLEPIALLVVVDDPAAISMRLAARDGAEFDASFIDRFQRREVARARAISHRLSVPLRTITIGVPVTDVSQWISDLG